jgi:MFS family permease
VETPKHFSWFESAAGIGSILSAIYLANLKKSDNMNKIMIAASLLLGFSVIILAYSNSLTVALICMALSGVGMMAQTSAINIYVQTQSTSENAFKKYQLLLNGVSGNDSCGKFDNWVCFA